MVNTDLEKLNQAKNILEDILFHPSRQMLKYIFKYKDNIEEIRREIYPQVNRRLESAYNLLYNLFRLNVLDIKELNFFEKTETINYVKESDFKIPRGLIFIYDIEYKVNQHELYSDDFKNRIEVILSIIKEKINSLSVSEKSRRTSENELKHEIPTVVNFIISDSRVKNQKKLSIDKFEILEFGAKSQLCKFFKVCKQSGRHNIENVFREIKTEKQIKDVSISEKIKYIKGALKFSKKYCGDRKYSIQLSYKSNFIDIQVKPKK